MDERWTDDLFIEPFNNSVIHSQVFSLVLNTYLHRPPCLHNANIQLSHSFQTISLLCAVRSELHALWWNGGEEKKLRVNIWMGLGEDWRQSISTCSFIIQWVSWGLVARCLMQCNTKFGWEAITNRLRGWMSSGQSELWSLWIVEFVSILKEKGYNNNDKSQKNK